MIINNIDRLVQEEGEDFAISFNGGNVVTPESQDVKRILVLHAPPSGSADGAAQTLKDKLKINPRFSTSTHLVIGRDGRQIIQMIPFNAGAYHAGKEYNRRSISIDLEYPGELVEKGAKYQLKSRFSPHEYILASGLGNSRSGDWPLYPKDQLDTLLAISLALSKKYTITDVVAYDEILSAPHPGSAFPIVQFREKLLGVNDRSMVLQEIAHDVPLVNFPGKSGIELTVSPIPQMTQVSVINERDDWYLVSVIGVVDGNPWLIGWVPKSAVRVTTDFVPVVRKDHYLGTKAGHRFQEIKPHKNGYEEKPLMEENKDPKALKPSKPPKYIIMHFTTGTKMESTINHFKDASSRVSTHLLIGRDGRVIQFLPFNTIAHHCGFSWWEQESNLNTMSIGIELDNAGLLRNKEDGTWWRRKQQFKKSQVRRDVHLKQFEPQDSEGNPDPEKFPGWEKFTKVQKDVAFKIVQALVRKYKIKEILGHDDVNLRNRYDPGPDFPIKSWRKKLFGRREPEIEEYQINHKTDLYGNFEGRLPNTKQATFNAPLPANSLVKVLREEPDFTLITVLKSKDPLAKGTGWIQTASLDTEDTKGAKGSKGQKKKQAEAKADKRRTTINQVFFKRGENVPTPKLGAGPFEFGTRVRIQEFKGDWALVVLLDRTGKNKNGPALLEGWMPRKYLLRKGELSSRLTFGISGAAQVSSEPLWRHKDDLELGVQGPERFFNEGNAVPEVYTLDDRGMTLTKQWQFFIYAINKGMNIKKISAILGTRRAFSNKKGFPDPRHPEDPPRANWFLGANLTAGEPGFDKTRTCARAVMTGTVVGDKLRVKMLDGNLPPPLKEGRTYPERIEEVDPDDYLYTPWTHRYMFFAANTVDFKGETSPFPNGAKYDWTGDGTPYTWLPHVSKFPILYPLSKLELVPAGEPIPNPYSDRTR